MMKKAMLIILDGWGIGNKSKSDVISQASTPNIDALTEKCRHGIDQSDMVLISGGSSVGMRDFTIEILSAIPEAEILAHGISISPGKPTILAKVGETSFWGLPGHVVSAMVVFHVVVRPFLEHIAGQEAKHIRKNVSYARLQRNLSSKQRSSLRNSDDSKRSRVT